MFNKTHTILSLIALTLFISTATAIDTSTYDLERSVVCNDQTTWENTFDITNFNYETHQNCPTSVGFYNNYNNISGVVSENTSQLYESIQLQTSISSDNSPPKYITVSAWGDYTANVTEPELKDSVAVTWYDTGNINVTLNDTTVASKNGNKTDLENVTFIPKNDTVIAGDVTFNVTAWDKVDFSNTGYSYGYGNLSSSYIYYSFTSHEVGVRDGNITHLNQVNATGVRSDIHITIPLPKLFEPRGLIIGTVLLLNLGLMAIGLLYLLIPDVMIDSITFISTGIYDLIQLAIATVKTGAEWLLFIKNIGLQKLKELLTLGLIFVGVSYIKEFKQAWNGQKDYATVFTDIFNDILQKLATLERITYRALDSISNVASLFVLTFNMIVNIYHKIRDSVPFI